MSGIQPIERSKSKAKKQQRTMSPVDESIFSDSLEEPGDLDKHADATDKINDSTEGLSGMTEEEINQHLKLCMKLSVENKINMKNAFGLHLIGIMQKIVNQSEKTDIQQASLSLQASSKIYAGRVEALYQDTMRFHSHLQNIVLGGKKDKNIKHTEDEIDMDEEHSGKKSKPQKNKCKSFLKSEESLSILQDNSALSTREPHGNFVTINSAFSTSRLAPKLLSCLQRSNDSCMLRCAVSEPSFKAKNAINNEYFSVPPKWKGMVEKIKKFSVPQAGFENLMSSSEVPFSPHMSTPIPKVPPCQFGDDDNGDFPAPFDVSMTAGATNDETSAECVAGKLDVLNITVDAFVNDISAAITDQGVDHRLLPPNSVLKKILDGSKRTSIKPSATKITRQKTKEPFFAGKSVNDIRPPFVKGRGTCITQKVLSEWNVENTSNIDLGYKFIEEIEKKKEYENESNIPLYEVLNILKRYDPHYNFNNYFQKQSQLWKFSRRKLCLNESHLEASFGNQTVGRVGSLAPNDLEGLALSFQNLSLHESMHGDDGGNASINEALDLGYTEDPQFENFASMEPFETDIEKLMVKPPDLVRPASMKYDKRPMNLDTEKVKDLMWLIICKHLKGNDSMVNGEKFVLFSVVYEELKNKLEKKISEFISMQFAFVVLLILANQKTLLIENVPENTDLSIKQDISEIDVTDNM